MSGNQPAPWQLLDVLANKGNSSVQMGGPVSGPLIVLRSMPETDASISKGGIFVVEKREQLEKLIEHSDSPLRFFVGHSGWSGGQLESEIAEGSWLTTKAHPDFVFSDHDDMWVDAIRETGRAFFREVLGIHEYPPEVSVN